MKPAGAKIFERLFRTIHKQDVPCGTRQQLLEEISLNLSEDMINKIMDMAANSHEKDLMLPHMEQFLWWSNGYPAFECPANVFEPEWIDGGLVSLQKIDCHNPERLKHLPAIVTYVISCLGYKSPKYVTAYITSTLLERSREDPFKVYYPYQLWELRPSFNTFSGFGVRSPCENNDNEERWMNYWSDPLASKLERINAFVDQLKDGLQRTEMEGRTFMLFDGRRIVLIPREWVISIDMNRMNVEDCKMLLRKFQEDPSSLKLPPEVLDELCRRQKSPN